LGIGFQNSWGENWGTRGFGRLTWEQAAAQFLDAIAIDFTTEKDSPQ
jgi:C1A family cysteine protease